MFVRSLLAKNFGRLEDVSIQLVDGVVVIRGVNEAGKTTLIEAIMYAMFGSSTLRGTIEDTVTYGMKPSDLKVVLEYGPYKVKRSKSSASVVGNGVKINGQGQVSNFFYELLGVQKGTEGSVLLSAQGETAGILDGKPGEVSSLIESLAGFYQIDDLITNLKEKFPSGNKAILDELLEESQGKLDEKKKVEIESPDGYLKALQTSEANLIVATKEHGDLFSKRSEYMEDIIKIDASVALKTKLSEDIATCKADIESNRFNLGEAEKGINEGRPDVSAETILINSYPDAVKKYALYKEVTSVHWEGAEWDGAAESLEVELKIKRKKLSKAVEGVADEKSIIRAARRRINNKDTCESCGQGVAHLHEKINKAAEEEIKVSSAKMSALEGEVVELTEYISALLSIRDQQFLLTSYKGYAENLEIIPWTLIWNDPIPVKPSDKEFQRANVAIKNADAVTFRVSAAKDAAHALKKTLATDDKKLADLNAQNGAMFVKDSTDLKLMLEATNKVIITSQKTIDDLTTAIKTSELKAQELKAAMEYLAKELKTLEVEIQDLKKRSKADSHNATLLNQVRKAKPLVLNRVWSSVLSSVSYTFSEMRGEESTVTKSEKGFVVNGLPVVRLSGSAKSILGIALRSSLRDIFAAASGFMVFDEPASDCSAERTAAVTAALASIRGQVLTITHEDISDGSADQIIEL